MRYTCNDSIGDAETELRVEGQPGQQGPMPNKQTINGRVSESSGSQPVVMAPLGLSDAFMRVAYLISCMSGIYLH